MKIILFLTVLISATSSFAGNCGSSFDQGIDFEASIGRLEPQQVFIREGDKVCLRVKSLDNSYNIFMQGSPIWLKATKKSSDETIYFARKIGKFTLKCSACETNATIEVIAKALYDEKAKKYYEDDSFKRRQKGSK